MLERSVRLDDRGAIVIPMDHRRLLGIRQGDTVILALDEGEVRILTPQRAIWRAQELVRRYSGLAQMQLTHNAPGDEEQDEIDNTCAKR